MASTGDYDVSRLSSHLPVYYRRLFPFRPFVTWLQYGEKNNKSLFPRREFAFILSGDVYLRYRSFSCQQELETAMVRECPHKLDIGAVFNHPPRDHHKVRDFDAEQRELVFDIDLTDYDDVRECCQGGSMCRKCWRFMAIAVTILDRVLKEHFGFSHLLFVYSGRRGVHCWVADASARSLSVGARQAIADYISVVNGGEQTKKKVVVAPMRHATSPHPLLQTAYDVIMQGVHIDKLVEEQRWLADEEHWKAVLQLCTDRDTRALIDADMNSFATSEQRWRALKMRFDPAERRRQAEEGKADALPPLPADKWFLMEFVLQYAYPRLDINVTTGLNHLLKSPFCVHPKTGKIAVPLNVRIIDKFDADSVPRLDQLISELAAIKENTETNRKQLDYKRTSLAPYVEIFEAFVQSVISEASPSAATTDGLTAASITF